MSNLNHSTTITVASSAAASTTLASSDIFGGLHRYREIRVDAELTGATGGTLDVYLQRRTVQNGTEVWYDWAHFAQVPAGGSGMYSLVPATPAWAKVVGKDLTPALDAEACTGGHPGDALRVVTKTGAGVSAAGSAKITVTGFQDLVRC